MPCSNEEGKYLSYKCYTKLEDLFERASLYDDGQKAFDSTIEQIKGSPYINSMDKNIRDMARFLTSDPAFSYTGYNASCMYMNFWLNKQVKNSYYDEYKSIFNFFDDFASKFAEERKKKSYFGYSCKNHIKELVDDEYHKRQILYELYDYYTEHITLLHKITREPLCENISLILMGSRDAKDYIEKDENLAKRLKELKDLIQSEKKYEVQCKNYNILDFMLPVPPPKVEKPDLPVNKPAAPVAFPTSEHDGSEHRVGGISGEDKTALSATEEFPQKTKLQEVPSFAPVILLEGAQELQPLAVLSGGTTHSRFPEGDRLHTPRPQAATILEHESELRPTSDDLLVDTQHARSYERGVLGSIQHTLTEVLGSVEPAPVLGVSGGMGALFLLFKYTPVGTFFRGRRGRTYGIPSGFNGPFQGGFSGYEDYYGGNVGNDRFHISYQAE